MKRITTLLLAYMLLLIGGVPRSAHAADGIPVEFAGVLSFTLPAGGQVDRMTSEGISYYPPDGGWISTEVLVPPEDLPPALTYDNERKVLQLCIDKMSETFDEVSVPRQDIVRTRSTLFFHTQDVSQVKDKDYLIYSDGFLFWTPKGIVVLWFANHPGNNVQDETMAAVLASLQLMDPKGQGTKDSVPVFTSDELKDLLGKEKLHAQMVESVDVKKEDKAKRPAPVEAGSTFPLDTPFTGPATLYEIDGLNTRMMMDSERGREITASLALVQAMLIRDDVVDAIGNAKQLFVGRRSESILSTFFFTKSRYMDIAYDHKNKTVTFSLSAHDGEPNAVLAKLKKDRKLLNYNEVNLTSWEKTASELFDDLKGVSKADAQAAEGAQSSTPAPEAPSGVDPTFKATMDAYEAFFSDYADFMKKYQHSDNALGMLADYTRFLTKYSEMMAGLQDIDDSKLSRADYKYYMEVMARIQAKLLDVAVD